MLRRLYEEIEGRVFDLSMGVAIPLLNLWVNRGLRREDLSEELRQFWSDSRAPA